MKGPSLSKKVKTASGKISYKQGIFLAFVFACLAAAAIIWTGGEEKPKPEEAKKTTVPVIVAKQDIPAHTLIRESMLKTTEVDPSMKPAGSVENVKDVVGKPSNVTILSGDVITKSKVLIDPKMAGFVGMIPNDCRAVSVPITDITGVGGFAKPGDHVDVMVINGKGDNNITGELLFQDVLLLAMNKNGTQINNNPAPAEEKKEGDKGGEGEKKDDKDKKKEGNQQSGSGGNAPKEAMSIATLALSPEEALELAVQSREGTVYLSLRPIRPVETFALDTKYFKAGSKAQPAPAAAPAPAPAAQAPAPYYPPARPNVAAPAAPAAPAKVGNDVVVFRGTEKTVE